MRDFSGWPAYTAHGSAEAMRPESHRSGRPRERSSGLDATVTRNAACITPRSSLASAQLSRGAGSSIPRGRAVALVSRRTTWNVVLAPRAGSWSGAAPSAASHNAVTVIMGNLAPGQAPRCVGSYFFPTCSSIQRSTFAVCSGTVKWPVSTASSSCFFALTTL